MECVAFLACEILNPVSTVSVFWNLLVYSLFVPNMDIATLTPGKFKQRGWDNRALVIDNGTVLPLWKIGNWQ